MIAFPPWLCKGGCRPKAATHSSTYENDSNDNLTRVRLIWGLFSLGKKAGYRDLNYAKIEFEVGCQSDCDR